MQRMAKFSLRTILPCKRELQTVYFLYLMNGQHDGKTGKKEAPPLNVSTGGAIHKLNNYLSQAMWLTVQSRKSS